MSLFVFSVAQNPVVRVFTPVYGWPVRAMIVLVGPTSTWLLIDDLTHTDPVGGEKKLSAVGSA